ncbi:MAG: hypothetical protein ACJAYU_002778 [Bradymonadia bacterium]|jgi:hypothetical protein
MFVSEFESSRIAQRFVDGRNTEIFYAQRPAWNSPAARLAERIEWCITSSVLQYARSAISEPVKIGRKIHHRLVAMTGPTGEIRKRLRRRDNRDSVIRAEPGHTRNFCHLSHCEGRLSLAYLTALKLEHSGANELGTRELEHL